MLSIGFIAAILIVITLLSHNAAAQRPLQTPEEIVQKFGYPVESHTVTTKDGYILSVQRIPYSPRNNITKNNSTKTPVFIMHGLLSSAGMYIDLGPGRSIAYLLSDLGYDVWLGNARGTKYSNKHVSIDPKTNPKVFYNFSWHEIGVYDLPAMIDYILLKTNQPALHYMGHSMGCTVFYVMASMRPEYNAKIRLATLMGPAGIMKNIPNGMLAYLCEFVQPLQTLLFGILKIYNFEFLDYVLPIMAKWTSVQKTFKFLFTTIGGFEDQEQFDPSIEPYLAVHYPSDSSMKQVAHFAQNIKSGNLSLYDYGPERNQVIYGSKFPPEYNLKAITAPVALYCGKNDQFVSNRDINTLSNKLPNIVRHYLVKYDRFNHGDFLYAKDVKKLLYNDLLSFLSKY